MNIELVVFAVTMLLVIALLAYERMLDRKSYEAREQKYLSMLKDLQNRLTAKDLHGYQFLIDAQKRAPETDTCEPLTDEREAEIEATRHGLTPAQVAALKQGLVEKAFQG